MFFFGPEVGVLAGSLGSSGAAAPLPDPGSPLARLRQAVQYLDIVDMLKDFQYKLSGNTSAMMHT